MPVRYKTIIYALLLSLAAVVPAFSQTKAIDQLKKELADTGSFTNEDFKNLESGELVIKQLAVNDKREVAVFGVVKLNAPHSAVRKAFEKSILRQRRESAKKHGLFSNPPKSSDLGSSAFDPGDLSDLKECRVGSCKWNLPTALIERMQSDLDWNDPNIETDAADFVAGALRDYVKDYLKKGNSALMVYHDKKNPLDLGEEYQSMEKEYFWVDFGAPEFANYLRSYPEVELKGIDETISWSEVKVALKPVIMINHNVNYPGKAMEGSSRFMAFSKQIYSNHYFDSSLTQTVMLGDPNAEDPGVSYLLFVNRSRAGALGGKLGRFARGIVQNQARGKLEELLLDTKKFTATVLANREYESDGLAGADVPFYMNPTFAWVAVLLPLIGLVFWFVLTRIGRRGLS